MTIPIPTPWLPKDAIAAEAARVPFRELVAGWSATWFARGGVDFGGVEPSGHGHDLDGETTVLNDDLTLAVPEAAIPALGELMFGRPADGAVPTPADRGFVAAAVGRAIDDLRERVAQQFQLPRDAAWRPGAGAPPAGYGFRIRITGQGGALTVIVTERLLIAAIKKRLGSARSNRPLGSISEALMHQSIVLSALAGTCSVPMREIVGLDVGDVLVLDRRLDETASLMVDGQVKSSPCRVIAGDTALNLVLA